MGSVDFYHYTTKTGLQRIKETGFIKESGLIAKDAHFGKGVYGTTLPPSRGRKEISQNNWGKLWKENEEDGKADRAIKLKIPWEKLEYAESIRDILIHCGNINIFDYNPEFYSLTQDDYEDSDDSSSSDE
eukprot:TRINITY_DN90930_c1_g1_i1.p1 TRINITY_DN90930_c1_g1~~TRINITY_DN90930_c1_g1_i1.p1  ORF type:complete len:143 (-),score=24.23 TRINITY_DN90930_c1_g1_i1:82-471(-)